MARSRKPARVVKWRGVWYLFYTDHSTNRQMRLACTSLGATNADERRELLNEYRSKEVNDLAEVNKRGGGLAYDRPLITELDSYVEASLKRVSIRAANPEARSGLSAKTGKVIENVVDHFKKWLIRTGRERLTTGRLDGPTLREYRDDLAAEPARLGRKAVKRSAPTINQYLRTIKTCLVFLHSKRPPRFPDFENLRIALKPLREDRKSPVAYTPAELRAFLAEAEAREQPHKVVEVQRTKHDKPEKFLMETVKTASTPVSRLFLVLALIGCRLGEALALRWQDVDLNRGRITIRAPKTGRTRWIPLVGAPEGAIAPSLLDRLRRWREEDPKREYVLPHTGLDAPVFPKGAWKGTNRNAGIRAISPQHLRQNFTSYAGSLGIPATVAAMWQGHGADVAEKHYRAQVLDRNEGASFDVAMGLA